MNRIKDVLIKRNFEILVDSNDLTYNIDKKYCFLHARKNDISIAICKNQLGVIITMNSGYYNTFANERECEIFIRENLR